MTAFLRRFYAGGGASTTLASAMGNSDTSFSISATTGWPGASPGANFIVVIDRGTSSEEKILCSSNSGTVVSVASSGRGYDGTSATSHNSNATVSLCGGAIDFDETNQMSHLLGNVAEGSLVYGKGAGVLPSALAIGTNGYYLTSNGTDPTWSALPTIPPLTDNYVQGPSSLGLTAAMQSVLTSGSLVAGTYEVTGQMSVQNVVYTSTNTQVVAQIYNAQSSTVIVNSFRNIGATPATNLYDIVAVHAQVVMAGTGTIVLRGQCSTGSGIINVVSSDDTNLSCVRIS